MYASSQSAGTVLSREFHHTQPAAAALQSFMAALAATSALPNRTTMGCMATFKETLLHSTLSASDTTALYLFLSRNAIPVTRTENKTTKTLQKLYTGVTEWTRDDANILDPAAWALTSTAEHHGLVLCVCPGAAMEPGPGPSTAGCPVLYLQGGEPCRLVVWQNQGFQVRSAPTCTTAAAACRSHCWSARLQTCPDNRHDALLRCDCVAQVCTGLW